MNMSTNVIDDGTPGPASGARVANRIRSALLPEMRCSEMSYQPGAERPLERSELATIEIILAGGGRQFLANRQIEAREGTVLYHPADSLYRAQAGPRGIESILVEILPQSECESVLPDRFVLHPGGALLGAAYRIRRELAASDRVMRMAIQAQALEIVAVISRTAAVVPGSAPRWIASALRIIESHYSVRLRPGDIAAVVGLNARYVAKAFRKYTGMTVAEYVRRVRVERAMTRLALSDEPLVQIGLSCGFCDQPNFTRVFREVAGTTPAAYREVHRPRSEGDPPMLHVRHASLQQR
ncbi:MAG TPA: AraC family transcriptional regulator [Thermoanaerobaculia bacterium]|nr:AraC family transcriptional regulator [Thermoanaerobaculia bacterium]